MSADTEGTELLIRARSLLERGWCRGAAAVDVNGVEVHPASKQAVAWCALGALDAAGIPYLHHRVHGPHPAYKRLQDVIGPVRLLDFNARQESVEPVLAAFERAITAEPSVSADRLLPRQRSGREVK
jgi:hypothetical protein